MSWSFDALVLSPCRSNGYDPVSITYSMTPQDQISAIFPSYVSPLSVDMTSGAKYAGVPTRLPGADCSFSCFEYPKSHSLMSGLGDRSMSVFSSFMSLFAIPIWCT